MGTSRLIDERYKFLAELHIVHKEQILFKTIESRQPGISWLQLEGRLTAYHFPNGEVEYALDGKPLIRFLPLRLKTVNDRSGFAVRAIQEYKVYE